MAMVTAKTEPNYLIKGFSHDLVDIPINKSVSVSQVANIMSRSPMGSTDCALPITYATKHRIPVDTFIVYTDNETNQGYGSVQPAQALDIYRQKMGRDARLIVAAFTASNFTIADPRDRGMLDIVGFDSAAPELIREFTLGNV
jgi:60 kDa SS-A/Ro ribonucleoprotein